MCGICEGNRPGGGAGAARWVRRFSVEDPQRHPAGFTIYKITSVLFPLSAPEVATAVCVWKRYSSICALHASLATLHAALHLAGKLPALPRATHFTRFNSDVISERAAATKRLLDFVAEHQLLFTSAEFVTFMQSGHEPQQQRDASALPVPEHDAPVLIPVRLHLSRKDSPPEDAGGARPHEGDEADSRDGRGSAESFCEEAYVLQRRASASSRGEAGDAVPLTHPDQLDSTSEASESDASLQHYTHVVQQLLQQIQQEREPGRARLLKREADRYLARAERLYPARAAPAELSPVVDVERPRAAETEPTLRREREELSQYRVVSAAYGDICLLHLPTQTYRTLTVVDNIPCGESDTYRLLLPVNIAHMCSLLAYVETDERTCLITERGAGGALAEYIATLSMRETTRQAAPDAAPSVGELVANSQRLLSDIDEALSERATETPIADNVLCEPCEKETPGIKHVLCERETALPENTVRQWGAELLTAIEDLHKAGVVLGELSISDLRLGPRGRLLLAYPVCYASAHASVTLACSRAHAHALLAPEIRERRQLSAAADWWAYGAIMYHLLCGQPLWRYHAGGVTSHTLLHLPRPLGIEAESLLTQLLAHSPERRLGARGAAEVRAHPYFRGVDWRALRRDWLALRSRGRGDSPPPH